MAKRSPRGWVICLNRLSALPAFPTRKNNGRQLQDRPGLNRLSALPAFPTMGRGEEPYRGSERLNRLSALPAFPTGVSLVTRRLGPTVSIAFRLCLPFRQLDEPDDWVVNGDLSQSPFGFACLSDFISGRDLEVWILDVSIAFRLCLPFRPAAINSEDVEWPGCRLNRLSALPAFPTH